MCTRGRKAAGTAATAQTKDCFAIQEKAGIVIQDPATLKVGDVQQYQPSLLACQQVELLQQILEKAGTTLNYGTFEEAGNSLKGITLSGSPDAWNYGAPPSADGDPPSYSARVEPDDEADGAGRELGPPPLPTASSP